MPDTANRFIGNVRGARAARMLLTRRFQAHLVSGVTILLDLMRTWMTALAALAIGSGVALVAAGGGSPTQRQDASAVSSLVAAAAAYVKEYQRELTSVVADETYTQHVVAQVPRDGQRPLETTLTSEIFFMFTAGHDWMAIRDVRAVNGEALEDRPDLRQALQQLPAPEVAGRFKTYNSRFNVGRITRNFNEPTLSLLVLDDRHRARFAFERTRERRSPDGSEVTLKFTERRGPTLIRNLDGRNAFAAGEVTVEPGTGRVINAILAVTINSVRATLSTRYAFEERLGIMVPARFGEHYEDGVSPSSRYEEIRCEATYTNFKRFEVTSRIR